MIYNIVRKLLFLLPPEEAHHTTMRLMHLPLATTLFSGKVHEEEKLAKEVAGIKFPHPIGLAAGFDKNALYIKKLSDIGFGFVEIGTVTPKPQAGNPQPRLFRLLKDKALINRMGFNNDGAEEVASRLRKLNKGNIIIGGNIGKNKVTPNEEAVTDYLICFKTLYPHVDYFVVNVSSPNTPGLRELQDKGALTHLLTEVQNLNRAQVSPKPVFLKIAPDLTESQINEIVEIVESTQLAGIIATNTTISREGLKTDEAELGAIGAGGLSGEPLRERGFEVLKYLRSKCKKETVIISSGGIMDEEEAARRIAFGADLVQLYTGFIYEGPGLISRIKKRLLQNL